MLQLAMSQMLYGAVLSHDRVPASQTGRALCTCADRMWGNMACLAGIHHWSDWKVQDPQRPSEQVRTCARCPRTKNNTAMVP